ncbi:hypothetical protein Tco_0965624 [Tanacetum coccineum]
MVEEDHSLGETSNCEDSILFWLMIENHFGSEIMGIIITKSKHSSLSDRGEELGEGISQNDSGKAHGIKFFPELRVSRELWNFHENVIFLLFLPPKDGTIVVFSTFGFGMTFFRDVSGFFQVLFEVFETSGKELEIEVSYLPKSLPLPCSDCINYADDG